MNAIQGVLHEELQNSLRIKQRYIEALKEAPKGCLRKKQMGSREYFYLVHREGTKVNYTYLGKLSEQQIQEYKEKQDKRKTYKEDIRKLNEQIDYLKRLVNVRATRSRS